MAKVFQIDTNGTLLTGLVSYYKLEDVSDFYGTNHLTNVNAAVFQAGKVNNGVKFNGTTQYLQRANPLSTAVTFLSMFGWVYVPTASEKGTFWHNGGISPSNGYALGVGATNHDTLGNKLIGLLDGVAWMNFNKLIGTGWHWVGMTRDIENWKGYVDNVEAATLFFGTPNTPASSFIMGADNPGDPPYQRYWKDMVDEFGFWNKLLSAQEMTDLYNGGAGQTMIDTGGSGVVIPVILSQFRRRWAV